MIRFITLIISLLVFIVPLGLTPAHAETSIVGKTVAIVGSVVVRHEGEKDLQPVVVPNPVFLHDVISTRVNSSAKFMMLDDSILKLDSDTSIELDEILVGVDQQQSTIKQIRGRLRVLLGKKLKPDSTFKVHTPVAVAGVRATDFEVIITDEGKTAVRCFEGEVEVRNIIESIIGEVIVVANHYTIVEKDKPPIEPIPIPASETLFKVLNDKRNKSKTDVAVSEFQKEQAVEGEHEVAPGDARPGSQDNDMLNNTQNAGGGSGSGQQDSGSMDSQLNTAEIGNIPGVDFSEQSPAGLTVIQVLGLTPAGGNQGTGTVSSTSTNNNDGKVVNTVVEEAVSEIVQSSTQNSIDEPILDSSSIAIDVVFPAP